MGRDFRPQTINPELLEDLRRLVRMAVQEDLHRTADLTTLALVPGGRIGQAEIVARVSGTASGVDLIESIIEEMDAPIEVHAQIGDGEAFAPKQCIAKLSGDTRSLLTCERTILNFLGRLCGIATLTARFVEQVEGTKSRVYDTRKTTPGWRRLEKYAVRCGGGHTHRMGLYDAVLIKDNHLACRADAGGNLLNPKQAVETARAFLQSGAYVWNELPMIEIEIDSLSQLEDALAAEPDIVLLDNMNPEQLKQAPQVQLEASGGVNLTTIREIAQTGVDRISVGSLTHSATNLDLGLDWVLESPTDVR
jgi:nicotinate-nucleotide pyrophosphorylase (carboxylating)